MNSSERCPALIKTGERQGQECGAKSHPATAPYCRRKSHFGSSATPSPAATPSSISNTSQAKPRTNPFENDLAGHLRRLQLASKPPIASVEEEVVEVSSSDESNDDDDEQYFSADDSPIASPIAKSSRGQRAQTEEPTFAPKIIQNTRRVSDGALLRPSRQRTFSFNESLGLPEMAEIKPFLPPGLKDPRIIIEMSKILQQGVHSGRGAIYLFRCIVPIGKAVVLSNVARDHTTIKIGYSEVGVSNRLTALNSSRCRFKYDEIKRWEGVDQVDRVEKLIHAQLDQFRYRQTCSCKLGKTHREIFVIPPSTELYHIERTIEHWVNWSRKGWEV